MIPAKNRLSLVNLLSTITLCLNSNSISSASLDSKSELTCNAFLLLGGRRRFPILYEILLLFSSLLLRLLPIFAP